MDSGRCRTCGRPFTAGEVMGFGILRARAATLGGPVVDFPCPGCRAVNRLVPHGHGRYAPPGQPPPPPPTERERRVPWDKPDAAEDEAGTQDEVSQVPVPDVDTASPRKGPPRSRAPAADSAARVPAEPIEAGPMDVTTAAATLGVGLDATAAEIERVFRARALLCHPDKVAHLDPEFVVLAERKFRLLQDAKDLLLLRAARDLLSGSP
jgi:hypothetical protein